MSLPLPNPLEVATMIGDLVGRPVTAKTAPAVKIDPAARAVATYVDESDALRAVAVCDIPVGASLGAALIMMPVVAVDDCIKAKALDEMLAENLYEVFNVLSAIFPKTGGPRLLLKALHTTPPPADALALLDKPSKRVDIEMSVGGYKSGRLAILAG
jgi:hypothetical protein